MATRISAGAGNHPYLFIFLEGNGWEGESSGARWQKPPSVCQGKGGQIAMMLKN